MKKWINGILVLLAGILYRLGGAGKIGDNFDFLRDTLTRDIGICVIIGLLLIPSSFWGILLSMGLTYGVCTLGYGGEGEIPSEQSDLYRMFGNNVFYAVGFLFGLAVLPFVLFEYFSGNIFLWYAFLQRIVLLTLWIPTIHVFRRPVFGFDSAQVEEFLRGVVITLTCLLF